MDYGSVGVWECQNEAISVIIAQTSRTTVRRVGEDNKTY
jgi:hypothetical protein